MSIAIERDTLHQAIDELPEHTLMELAGFIEFLQFKYQAGAQVSEAQLSPKSDATAWQPTTEEQPPFNPVYFPEGILQGSDFSPESIAKARKDLWAGFGKDPK